MESIFLEPPRSLAKISPRFMIAVLRLGQFASRDVEVVCEQEQGQARGECMQAKLFWQRVRVRPCYRIDEVVGVAGM